MKEMKKLAILKKLEDVENGEWVMNEIDVFIEEKFEKLKILKVNYKNKNKNKILKLNLRIKFSYYFYS